MSEEEKKAIEIIEIIVDECKLENKRKGYEGTYYDGDTPIPYKEYEIVLNLITKLQKENELAKEQLKKQYEVADERNDLLVKVQELQKESKEKDKEIERIRYIKNSFDYVIQKQTKQKDRQIDLMADYIATLDIEEDICKNIKKDNCDKMNFGECEHCIKQYFERKCEE